MTMTTFFIALGIAIITLLFILLWYVPHLFQQQAGRSAREAAQLRDMLLDMLNEQEAVMQRQAQLRVYPKTPAARKVIQAHAKWSMAR
jgi:hypothetical protein